MQVKYIQIIILATVFALQYLFEHVFPQRKGINDWKHERFNIAVGTMNMLLVFLPSGFLIEWLRFIEERQFGMLHNLRVASWLQLLLVVIVMDFWMYVWHRLNHSVPWLWKLHRFHHRDTKMNTTTAVRFHVLELFLSYPGKAVVCFIFGIGYLPLLVYEVLFFISVVIHHSNMYVSPKADEWYRTVFSSPFMHRIHHTSNWKDTDSNFGGLFSFWDRMFGSMRYRCVGDIEFGIPTEQLEEEVLQKPVA